MGAKKSVTRLDSYDAARWMATKFTRTTDGFLTGRAIVTSIGVFTYEYADGTVSRELRPPEEVFAFDSLESMKMKPVTNLHPDGFVTPENAKDLSVGNLGSNVTTTTQEHLYGGMTPSDKITDGIHVAIDMIISDADAITDILDGRRALSMGYTCEIENTPGVYMGVEYDCIQRNIRYNHCAIVDAARAGDAAQIHLDSVDAILKANPIARIDNKNQEDKPMKKVRIDGVDCEVDDMIAQHIASLTKRGDDAEKKVAELEKIVSDGKTEISKLEAERDTAKDRADKAEANLEKAKADALDESRIDSLVAERVALYDAADKAGVKIEGEMKMDDIKKAVIKAVFPSVNLDGKDAAYVSACFDTAVAEISKQGDSAQRAVAYGGNGNGEEKYDAAAARQRMIEMNRRLSRGEKEEA